MAYWPNERVVVATLASIAAEAERTEVKPPAILLIGEVVRLREKLEKSQPDSPKENETGVRSRESGDRSRESDERKRQLPERTEDLSSLPKLSEPPDQ
jgi:hypothetical protein